VKPLAKILLLFLLLLESILYLVIYDLGVARWNEMEIETPVMSL